MKAKIPVMSKFDATVLRSAGINAAIPVGTWWEIEHFRKGKLIDFWEQGNVCTTEGLTEMLDIMFHGATQITTWYILLFEDDYTPLITNTYAVPGFTESEAYDEATRVEYVVAAGSANSITNSVSKAAFTISSSKTIYGAALVGGGTDPTVKSNTAGGGTLFASSRFGTAKEVVDDDVLLVTCTITLADS
jgi:hypothetical protein